MTQTHRFSVSVAAAVMREDGRLLAIQRRDNGHWELPGGVLEPGEKLLDGLVREVHEETGFTVHPERLSGVYQNLNRDIVALVFACRVVAGEPQTGDESTKVDWLDRPGIHERMEEVYAVRLLDSLDPGNDGPAVRVHDGVRVIG